MKEHMLTIYNTMPKGFGCVSACVKIGQKEHSDGSRTYQTHSDDMIWDWWTKEMTSAINAFADCFRICSHKTKFGDSMDFNQNMEEMKDVVLDVELNVEVVKITNWVFLVNIVNDRFPDVKQTEEDPDQSNPSCP